MTHKILYLNFRSWQQVAYATSISALLILFASSIHAMPKPETEPPVTTSQKTQPLVTVKTQGFDDVKLAGVDALKNVKAVYLEMPSVAFQKSWLREFRTKVSNNYQNRIKEKYALLLRSQLTSELSHSGHYAITTKKSANTYVIRANISDLYINGPETISNTKTLVNSAGMATLQIDVRAPDGTLIAQIKDREETDRGISKPERATRASNYHDFHKLMRNWAQSFDALFEKK